MNEIVITVADLLKISNDMANSGMEFAKLSVIPASKENSSFISFFATRSSSDEEWTDFEEIEAVNGISF